MGYININTNAGLTDHIRGIVDAGLDLMRVSTISALDDHYNAYYKPRAYTLAKCREIADATPRIKVYILDQLSCFPWCYGSGGRNRSDDRICPQNGIEADPNAQPEY